MVAELRTKVLSEKKKSDDSTLAKVDLASFMIFGEMLEKTEEIPHSGNRKNIHCPENISARTLIDSPSIVKADQLAASELATAISRNVIEGHYKFSVELQGFGVINVAAHTSRKLLRLEMSTSCRRTREQLIISQNKMAKSVRERLEKPVRITVVREQTQQSA